MFQWVDYEFAHGHLVDSWLDAQARAMTGIEDGWDQYWFGRMRLIFPVVRTIVRLSVTMAFPLGPYVMASSSIP